MQLANLTRSTSHVTRLLLGLPSRMVKFQRIYNDLSYSPYCYFAEPPAGQLRFTNTATVNFTTDLVAAVAKMFPSKYFSTGGDELNEACYAADTQTQQELNATGENLEQALSKFTVSTHQALLKLKKTPVVWEGLSLWVDCAGDYDLRRNILYRDGSRP